MISLQQKTVVKVFDLHCVIDDLISFLQFPPFFDIICSLAGILNGVTQPLRIWLAKSTHSKASE